MGYSTECGSPNGPGVLGWLGGKLVHARSKVGVSAHRGVLAALNGSTHCDRWMLTELLPPLATADLLWKASNGAVQAAVSAERFQEALVYGRWVRRALRQAEVVQEE